VISEYLCFAAIFFYIFVVANPFVCLSPVTVVHPTQRVGLISIVFVLHHYVA